MIYIKQSTFFEEKRLWDILSFWCTFIVQKQTIINFYNTYLSLNLCKKKDLFRSIQHEKGISDSHFF